MTVLITIYIFKQELNFDLQKSKMNINNFNGLMPIEIDIIRKNLL